MHVPEHKRFQFIRTLGVGGMGTVYEMYDRLCDRPVALKTASLQDPYSLCCLKSEFHCLQAISHPNVVRVHDFVRDADACFFTMDRIVGRNIRAHLHASPIEAYTDTLNTQPYPDAAPLDPVTAPMPYPPRPMTVDYAPSPPVGHRQDTDQGSVRASMLQLAEALVVMHRSGYIHRDIKPTNILVTTTGKVTLIDFGLVLHGKPEEPQQQPETFVVGTPAYMAPEQAKLAPLTPAADWYSVGVILYQLLAGRMPFLGAPHLQLRIKQYNDPLPPQHYRQSIPADLATLCVDLLRIDPGDRPTGPEVVARLQGVDRGSAASPARKPRPADGIMG